MRSKLGDFFLDGWPTYKGMHAAAILQVVSSSNLPPQALNAEFKPPSAMKFSLITVLLAIAVSGGAPTGPNNYEIGYSDYQGAKRSPTGPNNYEIGYSDYQGAKRSPEGPEDYEEPYSD
ncbi:uncharacterized protein STEHIDRAFT_167139 [Stereum hirsutum FP-91666 SS1]|uniref:uncharacterized protein n=1 Tax=Stereum hirsutum (strain FP-91666) TaxID=721885 RepID=UPI000440E4C5|nr:uncharacterized protein STEHIDRAFT_167139 [Stereum hirsutum FP-91666 SS1]EIM89296.1 hypothetical protein STEHIDRAFT_167139 [Stereum hirsutum FP-91666 SS1]